MIHATYVLLILIGVFATFWALLSLGVVSTRDPGLYSEKEHYIEKITSEIDQTYRYLGDMPHHNRDKIRRHLDRSEVGNALNAAKSYHDVYFFFRNY